MRERERHDAARRPYAQPRAAPRARRAREDGQHLPADWDRGAGRTGARGASHGGGRGWNTSAHTFSAPLVLGSISSWSHAEAPKDTSLTAPRRPRPSAVICAEHHEPPVHLDAREKKVLEEAVRLGAELQAKTEASLLAYGGWLLQNVFGGDAGAAMADHGEPKVWVELVRRASGRTLGISRSTLLTAVRVAACDRRVNDGAWRNLDFGRRALLLPLKEPALLRAGAKHVLEYDLSHRDVSEYVSATLAGAGRPKQRRVTPDGIKKRVRALTSSLAAPEVIRRVAALREEMSGDEREELAKEAHRPARRPLHPRQDRPRPRVRWMSRAVAQGCFCFSPCAASQAGTKPLVQARS